MAEPRHADAALLRGGASCLQRANFLELRACELRRIILPRTPVNKGTRESQGAIAPALGYATWR